MIRKEIWTDATVQTNLKDMMLSQTSQTQKVTNCMIPLIQDIESSQIPRPEVEWGLPGAEGRGENGNLNF